MKKVNVGRVAAVTVIAVVLGGGPSTWADNAGVKTHVLSRVHFNTNVSDFEAARAFYGKLGFETLSGFPDTNTIEMAQAIGIETPTDYDGSQGETAGGYLLHGELIGLGFSSGVIDLIEFTIPRNDAPPHDAVNHLGMAWAVMVTTDLDADFEYMSSIGVRFLSAPVQRANGQRFAMFTDLDGTFYELREEAGEVAETETTHITRLGAVTINVSEFERSAAWYGMLGFEQTATLDAQEGIDVGRAMGFTQPIELRGGVFTHPGDGSELQLIQWLEPYSDVPPYPLPINHLGIHRMAFSTSDIEADVAVLKGQGVKFVSPVTPCCSGPDSWGGIVAFHDPDGTVMELVEQPLMTFMSWIMRLFN